MVADACLDRCSQVDMQASARTEEVSIVGGSPDRAVDITLAEESLRQQFTSGYVLNAPISTLPAAMVR